MVSCMKYSECSTGQICVNEVCTAMTPQVLVAQVPVWGWVIVAVILILIIYLFIRCYRSLRKKELDKKNGNDNSPESGPAPLPRNYKKPVELLGVADANRKADEMNQKAMPLSRQSPEIFPPTTYNNEYYPQTTIPVQSAIAFENYSHPHHGIARRGSINPGSSVSQREINERAQAEYMYSHVPVNPMMQHNVQNGYTAAGSSYSQSDFKAPNPVQKFSKLNQYNSKKYSA